MIRIKSTYGHMFLECVCQQISKSTQSLCSQIQALWFNQSSDGRFQTRGDQGIWCRDLVK